MTDKPGLRKDKDDSGKIPGEALSSEIHRDLSEASQRLKEMKVQEKPIHKDLTEGERQSTSEKTQERQVERPDFRLPQSNLIPRESNKELEHPTEQEKVAQEKSDYRYLNEEMHRGLSETSQQHRQDNQLSEARRAHDTRTKPERIEAQSDSTTKRLPESLDQVPAATQEHEFPQLPIRTEGKQATEVTQQEKASVPPIERTDNPKELRKNDLVPDGSNSRSGNKEPTSESEKRTLRQVGIGHNERLEPKHRSELTDKPAEHLEPIVRKDIHFHRAERSQVIVSDVAKRKGNDARLELDKHRDDAFQLPERLNLESHPSRHPETGITKHLETGQQQTEKDARDELRRHLDRIKELNPRTYMFVESSLNGVLRKRMKRR